MDYLCPKGHHSTDPEYCSECGAKIQGAKLQGAPDAGATASVAAAPAAVQSAPGGDLCPDCGTPRANPTAIFCEVCRYNFVTKASWSVPPLASAPPPETAPAAPAAPQEPAPLPPAAAAPPSAVPSPIPPLPVAPVAAPVDAPSAPIPANVPLDARWEAVVRVDPALYTDPDPTLPCPTDEPERVYHLDFAENLIGRRSDRQDIHPEVNLRDPGVSHRHAKLLRLPEGALALLDVGSTNGTLLNGVNVPEGVKTPLKEGDEITLGFWTRITIHETRS